VTPEARSVRNVLDATARLTVDHFMSDGVPASTLTALARGQLEDLLRQRRHTLMVDGFGAVMSGTLAVACAIWAAVGSGAATMLYVVCAVANAWTLAACLVDGLRRLKYLRGHIHIQRHVLAYLKGKGP
jgi:hypothetical protein